MLGMKYTTHLDKSKGTPTLLALKNESKKDREINPSNAEPTFVKSTRTQKSLKIIETLSCWYSLDSSRGVLSDEYPFSRVSVIFQVFCIHFAMAKLAPSSIRVNPYKKIGTFCAAYLAETRFCGVSVYFDWSIT